MPCAVCRSATARISDDGGLRDAILFSVGANAAHGLRRTNADKRRTVLLLWEDEVARLVGSRDRTAVWRQQ